MIRIMSPEVIAAARSVFGNTFGIGSCNDPPLNEELKEEQR
jgi:hypothetical protein